MLVPKTVDVLIVSYNTRELLRACLASIQRHRPPPDRVALAVSVLDNGSADGSADMVAQEFPACRLVRSGENLGFARANNLLATTSTADYLLLLNSDTVWKQDVVTPLVDMLDRRPGVALVSPRLVSPDGSAQPSSQRFPSLRFEVALALRRTRLQRIPGVWDAERIVADVHEADRVGQREPRESEFLWATCWLIRRSSVQQHGLFDETFAMYDEDLDFCRRLRRRGQVALYVPSVELVHVGGASSTSDLKHALSRRARLAYYRRNHGALAAAGFRLLHAGVDAVKHRRRLRLAR